MHVLLGMVLVGLFFLPLRAQAASSPPLSRKNNPAVVSDQEVVVTAQGIQIQVKERVLREVLEQIHQMSGVHFSLPEAMRKLPVTATIASPDWPRAIRELLRSFDTFEVWDKNGNVLYRVFISGHGRARIVSSKTVDSLEKNYQKREETKTPESPPTIPIPPLPGPPPTLIP